MARVSKIETKFGAMPSQIFSLSTMSASEKRELRNNLEIQLSKVTSTLQIIEEAETKRSDQGMCSVDGEKLGKRCGFHPSTPLKCDTGLTTTISAAGYAGNNKRGPQIELKDREVKRQKLNNFKPMENSGAKSVVTCAKNELISEAGSSTTCCEGRRISATNNRLHKSREINIYGPLSPEKAPRAALLKKRFSDTILRAKQKMNEIVEQKQKQEGIQSAKATLMTTKQKLKEIVDEEQQKESILSAEATSMKKIREAKLKMKLKRDRDASRKALQEMRMTVEINETADIIREVDMLAFGQIQGYSFGKNRLEMLGLFLKAEYCNEEDEDAIEDLSRGEDLEEGEIFC